MKVQGICLKWLHPIQLKSRPCFAGGESHSFAADGICQLNFQHNILYQIVDKGFGLKLPDCRARSRRGRFANPAFPFVVSRYTGISFYRAENPEQHSRLTCFLLLELCYLACFRCVMSAVNSENANQPRSVPSSRAALEFVAASSWDYARSPCKAAP